MNEQIALNDLIDALHQISESDTAAAQLVAQHIDTIRAALVATSELRGHGWWTDSDYTGWVTVTVDVASTVREQCDLVLTKVRF